MKCKLCGKSTKQISNRHCWDKTQTCGKCHYLGLSRLKVSY